MSKHGLSPAHALMRLDGEFGCARTVLVVGASDVGHLMRCADYGLLDSPNVQAALATKPQRFVQEDTGTEREVYDVGRIRWWSEVDKREAETRLVVTATKSPTGVEPKVGKRIGDRVFELFTCSLGPEEATALDVLTLYFGRGGFEQTLSEEDRELDPDRWFSGEPNGQELAQILAQWVWNMRLWLGLVASPREPRITLLGEAIPAPADTVESPVPVAPPPPSAPAAEAPQAAEPAPKDAPVHFTLMPDQTLRCSEGKTLRKREQRGNQIRFGARRADCRFCPRAEQCLGKGSTRQRGRRVDWPRAARDAAPSEPPPSPAPSPSPPPPFSPPPPAGPEPLLWHDLPATALRRLLPGLLHQQRVDITNPEVTPASPALPRIQTRAQRAHRRLTWAERHSRNALPTPSSRPHLHLHGISASLAAYVGAADTG